MSSYFNSYFQSLISTPYAASVANTSARPFSLSCTDAARSFRQSRTSAEARSANVSSVTCQPSAVRKFQSAPHAAGSVQWFGSGMRSSSICGLGIEPHHSPLCGSCHQSPHHPLCNQPVQFVVSFHRALLQYCHVAMMRAVSHTRQRR